MLAMGLCLPGAFAAPPAHLDVLRSARAQALSAHAQLQREQAALEPALQTVGAAISARKALDPVSADSALETLLQRHRELSERLTELSREQRASATAVLQATQALIDGVDREVTRLRRVAKGRSGAAKAARVTLRTLLAERSRFAVGPVGGGCALPEVELSAADGPEEARAKLDLLRDAEERCRRRIRKVDTRLSELRDERKLLREAADFRDEGELFDEESRRRTQVRVQQPGTPERSDNRGTTSAAAPAAGAASDGLTPGTGGFGTPAETPPSPVFVRQPQVDSNLGGGHRDTPEGEISSLTQQRDELERAALRIRQAHEALQRRAGTLGK